MAKCSGRDVSTGEFIEIQSDSTITYVNPDLNTSPSPSDESLWIAPGFIDLQVNGFAGADYNSPGTTAEAIAISLRAIFSTGVTRFFPTVITGAPERMLAALRNLAHARESLANGDAMEAFHVEGPHISPADGPRGAHPAQWVRPPDLDEFRRLQDAAQGNIRLVTLSPEWPASLPYIEHLARAGVVTSIGHTAASAAQIRDAVSAGATLSTHLGNGAHPSLPKSANYIWDQLAEDRLAASFIADGHHLSDAFLRAAIRAKGVERSLLVTDAVAPAMCSPGPFTLGEVAVDLKDDGRVVVRGEERLAGSSLHMDNAISNAMRIARLSLTEAVSMATSNPARVGRVRARQRGLRPGERADWVRFRLEDGQLQIVDTYLSGREVFRCEAGWHPAAGC
jgi:N-acetylglucosamine-6-phosphate deacetylase